MSKTIDQKVVEMQFDNKNFEHNVSQSMSTLDKLKAKLNFNKERNSLDGLQKAADNVDVSGISKGVEVVQASFSNMQIIGMTALSELTRFAINSGMRIANVLTDAFLIGRKE